MASLSTVVDGSRFGIRRKLVHLPERLILCVARRFDLGRIRLFVFLQSRRQTDLLRTKTAAALNLIEIVSPKCYVRVCRFIPRILIFGGHSYRAVYVSGLGLCDVSRQYALAETTTPSCLALTLAHEATHGYLGSRGFVYEEHRRKQIEAICLRTEVALARKLPNSAELTADAVARLNMPPNYWRNEAFAQRDIEHLKKLGAPRWMVDFLERRNARLGQRTAAPNSDPALPPGNSRASGEPPSSVS